jgi:outer membrane biosynthesis protein TonB
MMLDEMCYDSKARPIRERKMPENLTHLEMLARAQTGAAIKTLAEIATTSASPHIRKPSNAALRDFLHRFPAAAGDRRARGAVAVEVKYGRSEQ